MIVEGDFDSFMNQRGFPSWRNDLESGELSLERVVVEFDLYVRKDTNFKKAEEVPLDKKKIVMRLRLAINFLEDLVKENIVERSNARLLMKLLDDTQMCLAGLQMSMAKPENLNVSSIKNYLSAARDVIENVSR